MKMERLQKIIARAGLASRRRAEEMILRGVVSVNGVTVTTLGTRADPQKDHIQVDGKRVSPATRKVYVLLNKPKGYITSRHDPQGRPTVMDLVADVQESIYPVGRLDFDSEGLLLLTNDGDLAGALMHPRSEVEKTYWVKVSGHLTEAQMQKIARGGLALPGARTAPCKIREIRTTEENSWVEVILHEGKNREIRRVMQKIGHPVNKLKRVAYAFLKVGDLPPGGFRYLTPGEAERLQGCVKRRPESAMDAAPSPLPTPSKGSVGTPPRPPPRPPRRAPPALRPPARQREDPRADRPFAEKPRRGASSFGASDSRRSAKGTRPAASPSSHPKKDARQREDPRADRPFAERPRRGASSFGASDSRRSAKGTRPATSPPSHPKKDARRREDPRADRPFAEKPRRGASSFGASDSHRSAKGTRPATSPSSHPKKDARRREDPRAARPFAEKPRRGASSFGASDSRRPAKGARPATSPPSHPKKDARQREDPRAARPFAEKPRRGASSFGASDPRRSAKGTRPATSPSSHPKKDARPPAHPRARQRGAAVGSSPHPSSPHPQRGARFRVQPRPKRGAPSTDAPHSGRDARPPKKNHGGGPQNRGPNKRAGGRPGGHPPRRRA